MGEVVSITPDPVKIAKILSAHVKELEAEIEDINAERIDENVAYKACQEANAALWAFVRAHDTKDEFRSTRPTDGYERWVATLEGMLSELHDAREALRQYEEQEG